jgi:solute carrier family 38 (sodium-coupled neutral amino acid transporter), member 11
MSSSSSMSISSGINVTVSPFFAVPGSPSSSASRSVVDAASDGRPRNNASVTTGESSLFGAGFNFVNSIVGAGIIGMPIALKECGLFTGIFLIIFVAYLVNQSTVIIIECGLVNKKLNLEELCRHLFGVHGYNACSMSMFLFAYGAMIAYLMIIGDTVPIALDYFMGDDAPSRTAVMLVAGFCIVLPLSLLRDMSSLSSTSLLSIAADFFMVLFICARSHTAAKKQDTMFDPPGDITVVNGTSIAAGLGTISFAFVCQHSSFLVFQSMKEGTLANWKRVSDVSLVIAGTLCLLLGLVGYLSFGDYTQGDIMTNFGSNGESLFCIVLLFILISVSVTLHECVSNVCCPVSPTV